MKQVADGRLCLKQVARDVSQYQLKIVVSEVIEVDLDKPVQE